MARGRPLEVSAELVEAFVRSGEVTAYLFSVLPDDVWRATPPAGRGRTIASMAAHIQSVRRTFARMGGATPAGPSLDARRVTRTQAERAVLASTRGLARAFTTALKSGRTRVPGQPRRIVDMLTYLLQHDAHHRGQICALARDLGHTFAGNDITRLWGWSKLPAPQAGRTPRRPRRAK